MPLMRARARKPAASASDTRFEIVMVKRSLAAANAIRAGNSRRRAISRIMGYTARAADARSEHRPVLAVRSEQSGNGRADHQILAIRQARARSASTRARQTSSTGASSRLPAGNDAFLAATEAAAGSRIFTPSRSETTKAPDIRGL